MNMVNRLGKKIVFKQFSFKVKIFQIPYLKKKINNEIMLFRIPKYRKVSAQNFTIMSWFRLVEVRKATSTELI